MPTITDQTTTQAEWQEGDLTDVVADSGDYLRLLYSPNVVPDGDFSTQTFQPPYDFTNGGALSFVIGGRYGEYCLKFESTRDDAYTQPYSGADAALHSAGEGEEWVFSIDIKGAVGNENAQLFLFALGVNYGYVGLNTTNIYPSTFWDRHEITYTMPAGTIAVSTRVDNEISGDTIYYDGWQLEQRSSATPFHEGDYITPGNRLSPQLDLSAVGTVESSMISWTETLNSQIITIDSRISLDDGSTWTAWATCTNGDPIPDLPYGTDVSTALLECRQTLSTDDPAVTPQLDSLSVEIHGMIIQFFSFGF